MYSDGATEEEVSEVINSFTDVSEYITRIFESRSLDLLNTGAGAHFSKTEISHVATCADGESIFFTKKYRAFVFDSAKENVVEVSVDKLSPGDTVVFKSNNNETRDIVTTLLDKYIDEYQNIGEDIQIAYLKSRYWKEVLREYRERNDLTFKELSKLLEKYGDTQLSQLITTFSQPEMAKAINAANELVKYLHNNEIEPSRMVRLLTESVENNNNKRAGD